MVKDCRNCLYYREKFDHCFYNETEFNGAKYDKAEKCVLFTLVDNEME